MARRARFNLPGMPQHLVQRGNNRQATFFAEEDYRVYLDCLRDAADKYDCLTGVPDSLISMREQYERLGRGAEERQRAYRELFRTELDPGELGEIRDTVNRGWPLGSERFKDEIERALKRAVRPPKRGRPARSVIDRTVEQCDISG